MSARHLHAACALALALGPLAARPADAPGDARLRDALRTTTAQLRALEDEQAKWLAKEAQYQKELAGLRAELAEAKKGSATGGEARVLKQRLAEQTATNARVAESLAQCQKEAGAEAARARRQDEERAEVTGRLDGLTSRVAACEARNDRMLKAGKEFLAWLADPGSLCEPFFGLRRVALENRAQEFSDQLLDQKSTR
jgi:hypothetical protein